MCKAFCVALAWAALSACFGQSEGLSSLRVPGMPEAVAATMQRQQYAWNQSDLAGFMEGYLPSDSLMFIGKSGVTYGHEATLKRYMTGYPDASAMGTLTFENLKWISLGDQAGWLMGKWALKKEAQEDAAGMYTLLWRKFEGTWLIVADHSS